MTPRLAVDVGGANLTWAVAGRRPADGPRPGGAVGGGGRPGPDGEGEGELLASGVAPFPLWREPGALAERLVRLGREALAAAGADPSPRRGDGADAATGQVALALTGELADCFPDRAAGVRHIVAAAAEAWPGARVLVLCRDGGWRSAGRVARDPLPAAAANWLAPATWLARDGRDVLLADMGSTTTDLVPVRDGSVGSGARTDLERLRAGELVYTGLLRTPVAALVREVEAGGTTVPVAAERFAVSGDAHLWLGHIDAEAYRAETPDGRPPDRDSAGRRLARMLCSDPDELGREGIDAVARAAVEAQARAVVGAVRRQRDRRDAGLPARALVTGAGAEVLASCLRRAGLELVEPPPPLAGRHAAASTATCLALLAGDAGTSAG